MIRNPCLLNKREEILVITAFVFPHIGMKDSNGRESASEPSLKGNGFPKKVRTHFTAVQIAAMEKRFAINPYPTAKEREEIARVLQLHDVQIQVCVRIWRIRCM